MINAYAALNFNNEQAFFDSLQRLYAEAQIGQGLDFAAVLAYWRREAPLPAAWRQALAERVHLVAGTGADDKQQRSPSSLFGWVCKGLEPQQVLATGERLVVLLTPLVDVADLVYWLMPTFIYADGKTIWFQQDRRWLAAQFQALQAAADAIAQGTGDWLPVHRWYVGAGVQPQALSALLRSADDYYVQSDTFAGFLHVHTLLLVVREQLQRLEVSNQVWSQLLLRFTPTGARLYDWRGLESELSDALSRQFVVPLLRALLACEAFTQLVSEAQDYKAPLNTLFNDMGLSYVLAEEPERIRTLAKQLAGGSVVGLRVSTDFGSRCPAAALELEQVKHARQSHMEVSLSSPQALQWYRQLFATEFEQNPTYKSVLKQLVNHIPDDELETLIKAHFFDDADAEFPAHFRFRKNRDLLVGFLDAKNTEVRECAAYQLWTLAGVQQPSWHHIYPGPGQLTIDPQGWDVVMAACAKYPDLFAQHSVSCEDLLRGGDRPERWQMLWDATAEEASRTTLIANACRALTYPSLHAQVMPYLANWYEQAPELVEQHLGDGGYSNDKVDALAGCPPSMWPLVIHLAVIKLEAEPAARRGTIRRFQRLKAGDALAANPQLYAALDSKKQTLLLPLLNSAGVVACADSLGKVLASSNKAIREPAVKLIASCSADIIQRSGLLPGAVKARLSVLTGIAQSRDPLMAPLIAEYFADAVHDEQSRGMSLDALEKAGYPLADLDPWFGLTLAGLQDQAHQLALELPEGVWSDEFAALLQPLGEPLGRLLLALMLKAHHLPRKARQILALLSPAQRSEFALVCIDRWISENGSNDHLWLLQPMREYGDERAANALAKAVQEWKKYRTQKSALAIGYLCELPGKYGCYLARQQWENGKLGNSIKASASTALTAQAELRGLSLEEFLEVLAPDFGMGPQGLLLDVGPYSYSVRVHSDLSLVVFDGAGKASKNLPKAKPGEDAEKRVLAENQFKALSKNLKPVLKQQGQRLLRAMQLGHTWPGSTWQRLFLEHPLLNLLAQRVVWSVTDANGQALQRIRPDTSGGVQTLADEAYVLPEDCNVQVTHPLELDAAERTAWAAHFADYEVVSPIEQWSTPVQPASSEELQASKILRANGKLLKRGTLSGLLERWGYLQEKDTDGGSEFTSHYWSLDGDSWQVTVGHSPIQLGYFDADQQIEVADLVVYRKVGEALQSQCLGDLPPALLNTVLVQAQTLAEAGV
ncbi:DUF4132 domain-containing protein [Pseudomonas turukhanskensis]|uniref:DUF4132 domain-containing protein n=1 Tax=Pseudomonas turukhanskensis TaxID=1806536 RepID=A0A9W6K6A5_9PSED|nr:DUF4132 domain-containing protein [Pseudomonas turukhanskensis]GLK89627.1 hypothetical protein GCM10017655_26890 [Pseudomonas turukhanskensis]